MCDARLFGPQLAGLSAKRSIQIPAISPLNDIGKIADEVLQNAPPKFALGGLSMGGIVAMEVWRKAPDRITRLALLDTNPRAELAEVANGRDAQMARAKAGELEHMMHEVFIPKYLTVPNEHPEIVKTCVDMAMAHGVENFVAQSLALRERPDQCEALKNVTVPTLVLCGRQDQLCPIERHELLADLIDDSRLVIVEDAGHLPTLEQPKATNAALLEWLEL